MAMAKHVWATIATLTIALSSLVALPATAATKPNILFVIMDDVGIDQLSSFGYGGLAPPVTPTLDTIAAQGIMFRNISAHQHPLNSCLE